MLRHYGTGRVGVPPTTSRFRFRAQIRLPIRRVVRPVTVPPSPCRCQTGRSRGSFDPRLEDTRRRASHQRAHTSAGAWARHSFACAIGAFRATYWAPRSDIHCESAARRGARDQCGGAADMSVLPPRHPARPARPLRLVIADMRGEGATRDRPSIPGVDSSWYSSASQASPRISRSTAPKRSVASVGSKAVGLACHSSLAYPASGPRVERIGGGDFKDPLRVCSAGEVTHETYAISLSVVDSAKISVTRRGEFRGTQSSKRDRHAVFRAA